MRMGMGMQNRGRPRAPLNEMLLHGEEVGGMEQAWRGRGVDDVQASEYRCGWKFDIMSTDCYYG